jgi:hypothetical protein
VPIALTKPVLDVSAVKPLLELLLSSCACLRPLHQLHIAAAACNGRFEKLLVHASPAAAEFIEEKVSAH